MSFASPFPEVDIPSTSVYEYLFGRIDDTDLDRVALVDTTSGREHTYRELIGCIDTFAGAMAGRGIGVGDVVGLLLPNSSAFAFAFHGILRSGATATTINVMFTSQGHRQAADGLEGQDGATITAAGTGRRSGGGRRPSGRCPAGVGR